MKMLFLFGDYFYRLLSGGLKAHGVECRWMRYVEGEAKMYDVAKAVARDKPDWIFACHSWGNVNFMPVCELARESGIRTCFWYFEEPYNLFAFGHQPAMFDVIFCSATESVYYFLNERHAAVFFLPFGCEPTIHAPRAVEKAYDVVFVGGTYPREERWIGFRNVLFPLLDKYSVAVWGTDDWIKHVPASVFKGRTGMEGACDCYAQGRVVIGAEQYRWDPSKSSTRCFEALACGSFYVCDWSAYLASLFRHGVHLCFSVSAADTLGLVGYYLEHYDEAEQLGRQGRNEVLHKHTYYHRAKDILTVLNNFDAVGGRVG